MKVNKHHPYIYLSKANNFNLKGISNRECAEATAPTLNLQMLGRKKKTNCCECKQMPSKHLLVQIPYFSLRTYSTEYVLRLLHQTWSFRYWEVKNRD